jgi:hypothetical protein
VNKPTDVEIEAAAQAIFKTWADENRSDTTWAEALVAEKSPDLYPAFAKVAPLARKEARAALIAAADARAAQLKPPQVALAKALPMPPYEYQPYYTGSSSLTTGSSLLPRDWLQREVEKVRDEPPVESWFRLVESPKEPE